MRNSQLFSRRAVESRVDFRPDADPTSPFAQLRRLATHLSTSDAKAEDITDCPEALAFLREYTYRKIFTGTSHEDFQKTDSTDPQAIDWLIAVHETESSHFQAKRKS